MTITVTSRGMNLGNFMAQAALQANGAQGAYYLGLIRDAIGANPKVVIKDSVVGTVFYEDTISGTLTVTTNYIVFPTAFNEPPEINVANVSTSANLVMEIQKATDATIALILPIILAGNDPGDTKFDLSSALNGTGPVRTDGNVKIIAPLTLDTPSGQDYPAMPTSGIAYTIMTPSDQPRPVSASLFGGQFHGHSMALRSGESNSLAVTGTGGPPSEIPPFRCSVIGSHANVGSSWAAIVREGWQWYNAYKSWGASFNAKTHFTIFQTPNEYAMPGYSPNRNFFPAFNGGSGNDNGNAPPVPGALYNFVVQLLNNDQQLETFEVWNEYEQVQSGFFRGSPNDMARMMYEAKLARNNTRPGVKVLWPGMVNWQFDTPNETWANWIQLANATDGQGGTAKDHIDGFGHHMYVSPNTTSVEMAIYLAKARAGAIYMGKLGLPMYLTEGGLVDGAQAEVAVAAGIMGRFFLLGAAYGYTFVNPWSMDISRGNNWAGYNPWTNSSFRAVHSLISQALVNRTVRWAIVTNGGSVQLGLSGGAGGVSVGI